MKPSLHVCKRCLNTLAKGSVPKSIKTTLGTAQQASEQPTSVQGWVRSLRRGKNVSFLVINDGSTHESLQAVLRNDQVNTKLTFGSSVRVHGKLIASTRGTQRYEIQADSVEVLGASSSEYPLQKKYASAEHLRHHSHLRPRTQFTSALLRIQSQLLHDLATFFKGEEFIQVLPPILTSSDCEGAGETFSITKSDDFFGKKANLIVSSQLHLEALAMGVGQVWTIVPTFRAEKSTTARHLAEFRMIEAEVCFTQDLNQLMDIVESMIRNLTTSISTQEDLHFLSTLDAENIEKEIDLPGRWSSILGEPWARITYTQAIEVLKQQHAKQAFKFIPESGSSLQAEHEKYLAQHFNGPVFVTHYPASQKPFYMLPSGSDTVECFDLLVPSMGELCGGSLRDHNLSTLLTKMRETGMKEDEMQWYTDLRRYGTVRHGGFGIGWERLVGYLCGVSNVREIAAFPRWVNHCVA